MTGGTVDVILTGWVLEVVELMDSECRAEICSRNVYCGIWDVMDNEQLPFVDMPLYIFISGSVSPLLDIATMLKQYSGLPKTSASLRVAKSAAIEVDCVIGPRL